MSLAEFLRRNRDRILSDWEAAVRTLPAAAGLDSQTLRDRIPVLLDRIAASVERGAPPPPDESAESHAIERIEVGFSVEELTHEYALLRKTLLRLFEAEGALLEAGALLLVNCAIDDAVERAVAKYHRADVRKLEALDQVAQVAGAASSLDELLKQLLTIVIETTDVVDTGVIYLREWDRLVVRAGVGLEAAVASKRFTLAVGEGFAGTIAARKEALFTPWAARDSLVKQDILRLEGVRALYGVPLVYGDEVIGVAKMGSRQTSYFPEEDKRLLRAMADRAAGVIAQRRLMEERELLLAVLGHDLRAPLNTIMLGVSLVQRRPEPLSASSARNFERMALAARRMDRMISDLTDLTKLRVSGGLPLDRQDFDLHALVQDLAAELRAVHPQRELKAELVGPGEGVWDRNRVFRLLTNLVNNAMAYGAPGTPVTIRVEGRDPARVTLCVHNEGAPISSELRPYLFEPYRKSGPASGTGLGLYIVRQIAHAHGGSVNVESTAEQGTTFRVQMPRRPETPNAGDPQNDARPVP